MPQHKVATRHEWLAARVALLQREKELTRHSDELARQRQELPWVRVEEDYEFETEDGTQTLRDLFDGRSQLLVFHLMMSPDQTEACPGCTFTADNFEGAVFHLNTHGVTFVAASRTPLDALLTYKRRLGWTFPWVSSLASDFNRDFGAFTEEDRRNGTGFNFGTARHADIDLRREELHGISAFALEDGVVYHTYSCYDRGTDGLTGAWQLLDIAPNGREGAPEDWPRRRYEYDA
jgi:predicted dithiol-disulfide oxidoreductase (DUF899 family)